MKRAWHCSAGTRLRDDEIKFGYAITGTVTVADIKQNKAARIGDHVLLTKPLGIGLITTAIKRGKPGEAHVREAIRVMCELNRRASEIALEFRVSAMTDITGFGLVGHASEVARASGISVEIDHRRLPVLDGALEYSKAGYCAGGLTSNREYYSQHVRITDTVSPAYSDLVFDPQTSGGLLIFVHPDDAEPLIQALVREGLMGVDIGRSMESRGLPVHIV